MRPPRVLVLRAAGTNCDEETEYAWTLAGARPERVHVNRLLERPETLLDYHVLTIPGGFSYGDDVASGKILANQLRLHLLPMIVRLVDRGGLVLGICNGFQVLVKAGLLPGPGLPAATLTSNASGRFEARWVTLQAEESPCVLLRRGERYALPVAHGEGRFVVADSVGPKTALSALKTAGAVALRYVAADGGTAGYPDNPNGSEGDIAGLVDSTGRVFGLMPHPERCIVTTHRPDWTRDASAGGDGLRMFRRAVEFARD